jgi:hypothetical protein
VYAPPSRRASADPIVIAPCSLVAQHDDRLEAVEVAILLFVGLSVVLELVQLFWSFVLTQRNCLRA